MSSIANSVLISSFAKHWLVPAGCSVLLLGVLSPPSRAQESTAGSGAACVSPTMIRQMVRDGKSIRVSPAAERIAERPLRTAGALENEKGVGLAQEPENVRMLEEAHRWFEKAASKGYAPAQVNLAVLSLAGWGTAPNGGTALYWLREAARQEYALAYFDLGVLYLEGCGVRRDEGEAFRYFERGAALGDSAAEMNLGYLYDQGLGVAQNREQAAAWYRKAAEQGVAKAQYNLADLYLRGEGVTRDEAAAFALFEKAALQGHTGARIILGSMYAEGLGTAKNAQAAYEWILAASIQGDMRGAGTLRVLEHQLSAGQLTESKLRAASLAQTGRARSESKVALLR